MISVKQTTWCFINLFRSFGLEFAISFTALGGYTCFIVKVKKEAGDHSSTNFIPPLGHDEVNVIE